MLGFAGPCRVKVPEAPVLNLNRIAAVLDPVVPRVKALAPLRVAVAPCKAAVVVMLLPVEIVPKPDAIEPLVKAPVEVMLPCTADGRVWLRLGLLLASVTRTLLAAAPVA